MNEKNMGLIIALVLTIIIECGIVALQSRDWMWVLYVALINAVTNPTLNIILLIARRFLDEGMVTGLTYILEILVVLSEGFMIYKLRATGAFKVKPLSFPRSLLYAFNINCASYLLGLLLF